MVRVGVEVRFKVWIVSIVSVTVKPFGRARLEVILRCDVPQGEPQVLRGELGSGACVRGFCQGWGWG